MEKKKFFATKKSDISRAAIDFFSLGHIIMGQFLFFLVYAIIPLTSLSWDAQMWGLWTSITLGVIWEPFENIIMYKMGFKFEGQLDSIVNAIFDIIFWTLGAVMAYFINNWIINLILFIVESILWFYLRWYFTDGPASTS